VQINGGVLQAAMPEEQLDRAQVGARFQHMSGEAVAAMPRVGGQAPIHGRLNRGNAA
jgi:hypothetical protein